MTSPAPWQICTSTACAWSVRMKMRRSDMPKPTCAAHWR
jgi:hypothetical protein